MQFRILCLIFGTITSSYCQPSFQSLEESIYPLQSIDPADTNYAELQFLKSTLKNKRVVLLGEQEHGDGAAFSAKIRLIKFLNKEMGFNVLAFETPLFNALTSWEAYRSNTTDITKLMSSSLYYKHWVRPDEMLPLAEHIRKGGLTLTGMDLSFYTNENERIRCTKMVDSVESILNISANSKFQSALRQLLRDGIKSAPTKEEKVSFSQHLDSLIAAFPATNLTSQMQLLRQELMGLNALAQGWWQKDPHARKNWWSSQNMRDRQMADNIAWLLSEKFKGEKIIVWAANYHISKFVDNAIQKDRYFQNDNAIPMGEFLFNKLGDEMYSIGVCSYSGERTLTDYGFKTTTIKPRSSSSLEHHLHQKGYNYAYIDFARRKSDLSFKLAGLSHYELQGMWGRVFDAMIFIDKMKPLTIK